jgi:hypothetical protein
MPPLGVADADPDVRVVEVHREAGTLLRQQKTDSDLFRPI